MTRTQESDEYPIILRLGERDYELHLAFGHVVGGTTKGVCERYAKSRGFPKPNYRDDRPGHTSTYQNPFGRWG